MQQTCGINLQGMSRIEFLISLLNLCYKRSWKCIKLSRAKFKILAGTFPVKDESEIISHSKFSQNMVCSCSTMDRLVLPEFWWWEPLYKNHHFPFTCLSRDLLCLGPTRFRPNAPQIPPGCWWKLGDSTNLKESLHVSIASEINILVLWSSSTG
jgi:hypothetical protein